MTAPQGRPRGEIRALLMSGFAERGASTVMEVLPYARVDGRSPAEVRLVRKTVENMVAAGDLVKVGMSRPAGGRVWHGMYEPAPAPEASPASAALDELQRVTHCWAEFF